MTKDERNQKAVAIGKAAARRLFDLRSRGGRRNTEIHATEVELAAMIAIGALNAWEYPPDKVPEAYE